MSKREMYQDDKKLYSGAFFICVYYSTNIVWTIKQTQSVYHAGENEKPPDLSESLKDNSSSEVYVQLGG